MNVSEIVFPPVRARGLSSPRSCALFLLVSLASLAAIVATINGARHGIWGIEAALAAAAVVATGMIAALAISSLSIGRPNIQYALGAQLVRLGVPLAGGLAMHTWFPTLANADIFLCVLLVYLPALAIETWLSVRMLSGNHSSARAEAPHG